MSSSHDDAFSLSAMALLATLRTAAETSTAISERRAGRDPAAQEPASRARSALQGAREELAALLLRLRTARAFRDAATAEATSVRSVRHFDALMTLSRTERLLHTTHQRLMSLYPEVPVALVEAARQLHTRCLDILSDDSSLQALDTFIEEALQFTDRLKQIV